ncbi:MAG: hypothetical protein HZB23_08910 [Deltaproteobacteria bacterium]|nr:hypothetical protein [Deltaproteobacteria bacterium]
MLNNSGALNNVMGLSGDLLRDEIEKIMERAAIANKLGNLDSSKFADYSSKVVRGEDEPPSVPEPGGETRKNVLTAYLDDNSGSPADSGLLRKLEDERVYPGLVRAVANHPEPDYVAQKINRLAQNYKGVNEEESDRQLLAGMESDMGGFLTAPSEPKGYADYLPQNKRADELLDAARKATDSLARQGKISSNRFINQYSKDVYLFDEWEWPHKHLGIPKTGLGKPYYSCVEQTEHVIGELQPKFPEYEFKIISRPFHTFGIGVPKNKGYPHVIIDPLKDLYEPFNPPYLPYTNLLIPQS